MIISNYTKLEPMMGYVIRSMGLMKLRSTSSVKFENRKTRIINHSNFWKTFNIDGVYPKALLRNLRRRNHSWRDFFGVRNFPVGIIRLGIIIGQNFQVGVFWVVPFLVEVVRTVLFLVGISCVSFRKDWSRDRNVGK